jgi:hypothetical protein
MRMLLIAGAFALTPAAVFAQDTMQAEPAPAPAAEAAAKPDAAAIGDKVKADWPKYDSGGKGHLNKAELGKWLSDLRTAAGQPAPDAKWQASAFAQADGNADKKVSSDELTAFLSAS